MQTFLTHLAVERHVSASTQNQALSAILFLYRDVLKVDDFNFEMVVHARRPERLPVVLTREEVRVTFGEMSGTPRLVAALLYGAGLRLPGMSDAASEGCRLRKERNSCSGRQRTEGPPDDASGIRQGGAAATS